MDCQLIKFSVPLFLAKTPPQYSSSSLMYCGSRSKFDAFQNSNMQVFSPEFHWNSREKRKEKLVMKVAYRDRLPSSSSSSKPPVADFQKVRIQILNGCHLQISKHHFNYNGEGGEGIGYHRSDYDVNNSRNHGDNNIISSSTVVPVSFDMPTLHIKPLTNSNTRMNGYPFPPFMKINIVPHQLFGNIDRSSGKVLTKLNSQVELQFKANFRYCAGIYKAPPLVIDSVFTTEESPSQEKMFFRAQRGDRLNRADGRCKLVAMAKLDAVNDIYLNSILELPAACLIVLRVRMSFS